MSGAKSIVKLEGRLPKMVVFDLDFTLWDCWCDVRPLSSVQSLFPVDV